MGKKSIIVLAEELPSFQKAGHNVWLQGILDLLVESGASVTLYLTTNRLGFLLKHKDRFAFTIASPYIKKIGPYYFVWNPSAVVFSLLWGVFLLLPRHLQVIMSWSRKWLRKWKGYEHRLGKFPSPKIIASAKKFITDLEPSVIIFNSVFLYVQTSLPRHKQILLVHDIIYERAASLKRQGYRTVPECFEWADERQVIESVGTAVCIQWDEALQLRDLCPQTRFIVIPPAMPPRERGNDALPRSCIFVGSGSLPNVDGLTWLLDEVWPSVRARVPDAKLRVFGTVCSRVPKAPDGVELCGVLEEMSPAYAQAQIAVIPLRVGSGLKIKIVEALTHAMPIVTTSVGAQGLMHLEPRPFALADGTHEMVDAISDLLISAERRLELEARARGVRSLFDPTSISIQLTQALELTG